MFIMAGLNVPTALKYSIILAVCVAIFSVGGAAFFGVAFLSSFVFAAMLGLFIPAILVLVAFLVLLGVIPAPWQVRIGGCMVLIVLAWFISSLPGGGF